VPVFSAFFRFGRLRVARRLATQRFFVCMGSSRMSQVASGKGSSARSLEETILEFGAPVLAMGRGPRERVEEALHVVVTMWNAHVLATSQWKRPSDLAELKDLVYCGRAPDGLIVAFEALSRRRAELFADDVRLVASWELLEDERGRMTVRCQPRLPRRAA